MLVEPDQEVKSGDVLIVMEAMKMEVGFFVEEERNKPCLTIPSNRSFSNLTVFHDPTHTER